MSKHAGLYCVDGKHCTNSECTEQLQFCRIGGAMPIGDDLANQIANLKQRIAYEGSFSHLDMVHNVLPIIRNLEKEIEKLQDESGHRIADLLIKEFAKAIAKSVVDKALGELETPQQLADKAG